MSDPVSRCLAASHELTLIAGQLHGHAPANAAGLNAAQRTIEHAIEALKHDVMTRDEAAAASALQDAAGTALIGEKEYAK